MFLQGVEVQKEGTKSLVERMKHVTIDENENFHNSVKALAYQRKAETL